MGLGASVSSSKETQKPKETGKSLFDKLKTEIRHVEQATLQESELDAFIDATQAFTTETEISGELGTIKEPIDEVIKELDIFINNINIQLEILREKVTKFGDAAVKRCQECSENGNVMRVRQKIRLINELILKAKNRLENVNTSSGTPRIIKTIRNQVQDLERLKRDIQKSQNTDHGKENDKLEQILKNEGGKLVLEDILKWRNEALELKRKYETLLNDNKKIRTEENEEFVRLEDSNTRLVAEVMELRREVSAADLRVDKADSRVQVIEEKLLEERLSHEVEVNYLKALLERIQNGKEQNTELEMQLPEVSKYDVRLTPEGILDTEDSQKSTNVVNKKVEKVNESKRQDSMKRSDSADSFKGWINQFEPNKNFKQPSCENEHDQPNSPTCPDLRENVKTPHSKGGENESVKLTLDKLQSFMTDEKESEQGKETLTDRTLDDSDCRNIVDSSHKDIDEDGKPEVVYATDKVKDTFFNDTKEVVCIKKGNVKEIIYRRNDGDIDGNLSYYKGIGAVIKTDCEDFDVDSVHCEIDDCIKNDMLPDFVDGERPVSFHIHFQQNNNSEFTIKPEDTFQVFVPHRPVGSFEEASLIQCVDEGDWEPCETCSDISSSVDTSVDLVGTSLPDITDIKFVVIAREKADNIIAGEDDVSHVSVHDKTTTVEIPKDTFKTRTEVKQSVHYGHQEALPSAIEIHPECQRILSCTAFVSLLCEQITHEDMIVHMFLPDTTDVECKYTMFSREDSGWKLADCEWRKEDNSLKVRLRLGTRKYRIIGLELPIDMSVEESLTAVKVLYDHTQHYLVRLLVRQRLDRADQAVVICLRSQLVKKGIHQLKELGYNVGGYPSSQFCMMEGDTLFLQCSGDVVARPINTDKLELSFYSQKEIATMELRLEHVEVGSQPQTDVSEGCLRILKNQDTENVILAETIYLPKDGVFSESFLENNTQSTVIYRES